MKPSVDTTKFRDAIRQSFKKKKDQEGEPKYSEDQGVEMVPVDDQEIMGESIHKPYTVRHWAGWVYQKRPDGKWDKLVRVPKKIRRKK